MFTDFSVGHVNVPFVAWLTFYGVISQIAFADLGTDSMFTGTSMRTVECDHAVNDIWDKTWRASLLGAIPTPSLWLLSIGSWSLSLVQIVVPLLRTLRSSDTRCATPHAIGNSGTGPDLCGRGLLHDADVFYS